MQRLQINRRLHLRGSTAKDLGRSRAELPFPLRNLIGMYVKPLCQFSQRFIAANATLDLNTAECVRLVLFGYLLLPFIAQEGHQR
jgi:hypothetical protein